MAITDDFCQVSALQLRVRGLERRVAELESGEAYARLEESRRKLMRDYEAQVKRLKKEVASRDRDYSRKLKEWFEVFEGAGREAEREHRRELRLARLAAKAQEERALRAERRVDALLDAARELRARIAGLEAELEELRGKNAKLTAQVNKDFTNSSIPSSKQRGERKKIPNTRESTGRPRGAQPGHEHHPRTAPEPDETVVLEPPAEWADDPDMYPTDEWVSKKLVEVYVVVRTTEYLAQVWRRRSTGGRLHAKFPEGLRDDVTYGPSCKALAFMPANGSNVSIGGASTFFREAAHGAVRMSGGFLWKLGREFAAKSAPEQEEAVRALMTSPVMHADFTVAMVDGKRKQVLILADESGNCLMIPREHKGHEGVRGTPLENYVGTVVNDHDTTWYKYGTAHQECQPHNIRYLIGGIENEPELTWHTKMLKVVRAMVHYRNRVDEGTAKHDPRVVAELERRYDKALRTASGEYTKHPPTKYYREGHDLFKRLRDYRESELLFLHDLTVPSNNSLAERLARVFKRKQHQATTFRSMEGLEIVCVAKSVIDNARSHGEDVFETLTGVFSRPTPGRPPDGEADPGGEASTG